MSVAIEEIVESPGALTAVCPQKSVFETEVQVGDTIDFFPANTRKHARVSGQVVEVIHNQSGGIGYEIHAPVDGDEGRTVRVWAGDGAITKILPNGNQLRLGRQETPEHAGKFAERHNERQRQKAGLFADQAHVIDAETVLRNAERAARETVEQQKKKYAESAELKAQIRSLVSAEDFTLLEQARSAFPKDDSYEYSYWRSLLDKYGTSEKRQALIKQLRADIEDSRKKLADAEVKLAATTERDVCTEGPLKGSRLRTMLECQIRVFKYDLSKFEPQLRLAEAIEAQARFQCAAHAQDNTDNAAVAAWLNHLRACGKCFESADYSYYCTQGVELFCAAAEHLPKNTTHLCPVCRRKQDHPFPCGNCQENDAINRRRNEYLLHGSRR